MNDYAASVPISWQISKGHTPCGYAAPKYSCGTFHSNTPFPRSAQSRTSGRVIFNQEQKTVPQIITAGRFFLMEP